MDNKGIQIDLTRLIFYILKRCWLVILCGIIGFAGMYYRSEHNAIDTYSASGTMYVLNANPKVVNYEYLNAGDLETATQLIDTYMVVVKSNKVMNVVAERLCEEYPGISPQFIASTLSMAPVEKTGVVQVVSTTWDPKLSRDICNAVMDVAPQEIIRVVSAGSIEIIDYAEEPSFPNPRGSRRQGLIGALAGMILACGLLFLLFLLDHRVKDERDVTDHYTPPVLSSIQRSRKDKKDPKAFVLTDNSPMEVIEGYAKLRMNLVYTMAGKEKKSLIVTSAVSGEGKSTVAANLAISCAMAEKKVLLIDGDLRRSRQNDIFGYDLEKPGLSDVLIGKRSWREAVLPGGVGKPAVLLAGPLPPNPGELLSSKEMKALLSELEAEYDLVLLDVPPVNIVSDPLVLSGNVAGCLFVIRQDYTDHRELRKALISSEMMSMNVMGFVFYGDKLNQGGKHYSRKYYKDYYKYDKSGTTKTKRRR